MKWFKKFGKKHWNSMFFSFRQVKKEAKNYNGWDWCEVYDKLDINSDPPDIAFDRDEEFSMEEYVAADEELHKRLRDEIDQCCKEIPPFGKGLSERSQEVLLACRAYAWSAGHKRKSYDYKQPMWYGLSLIRSDEEFLKMYRLVFPFIWD